MKNPTAIASFEAEEFAEKVAHKLRDAGFDARVRAGSPLAAHVDDAGELAGIYHVVVPAVQTARASSWCREFDAAESLLSSALRCPNCGSTRVTLRLRPSALTEAGENSLGRIFRCEACHSAWAASPIAAIADRHAA
jgi:hypothetical protein